MILQMLLRCFHPPKLRLRLPLPILRYYLGITPHQFLNRPFLQSGPSEIANVAVGNEYTS